MQDQCVLGPPGYIDAFEFARRGQSQTGVVGIHRFQRLLDGLKEQPVAELVELSNAPTSPGLVKYTISGRVSAAGKSQLLLHIQAQLLLDCQRCMEPMIQVIDRHTVFELVRRESDIDDSLDEDDDNAPEQIVGARKFDLLDLIEDELILEVPYVPRHEVCVDMAKVEDDTSTEAEEEDKRPSPFAVLEQLKTKR